MKNRSMIIKVFFLMMVFSCGSARISVNYPGEIKSGQWLRDLSIIYEVDGKKHQGVVQIYFPVKYVRGDSLRTLITLHGYKHTCRDWERNTTITKIADTYDFIIVCPDMSTTLYESRYYPETKNKWAPMPGGKFITDVLIPYLKKEFGVAQDRQRTGIFGLSTGGRGAVLIAALRTDLFGAAGGLSGDFDPELMKNDPLLTSVYGTFDRHTARWKDDDNIIKLAENLKNTPIYIAHGSKDTVVPYEQSIMLGLRLRRLKEVNGGGYVVKLESIKSATGLHDWKFWGDCLPDLMAFFNEHLKR